MNRLNPDPPLIQPGIVKQSGVAPLNRWKAVLWRRWYPAGHYSLYARGRRPQGNDIEGGRGTIPACAGQTCRCPRCASGTRDHPRVCGADCPGRIVLHARKGPSPRVRGRLDNRVPGHREQGTIPACAGQTSRSGCRPWTDWDHPRVCGADVS